MNNEFVVKRTFSDYLMSVIKWTLWVILIIYCITLFVLPIWMLLTSFKTSEEYYAIGGTFKLPGSFYYQNYVEVFHKLSYKLSDFKILSIFDMAGISVLFSFGISFVGVALTTMMAYVLSKYKFFGSSFLYSLGIIVMIVPIIGSTPSAMMIKKALGVYDNLLLTILTGTSCAFSGLHFLLLHGAFKQLPWDYAEAVFVDGGNDYTVFFRMYLPMVLPTCTVIFILNFLGAWNDYATFMIWLPSTPNLAYGLYLFQSATNKLDKTTMPVILAGFTIVVIPTVILFLASQNLILSKFTVGGLKG